MKEKLDKMEKKKPKAMKLFLSEKFRLVETKQKLNLDGPRQLLFDVSTKNEDNIKWNWV